MNLTNPLFCFSLLVVLFLVDPSNVCGQSGNTATQKSDNKVKKEIKKVDKTLDQTNETVDDVGNTIDAAKGTFDKIRGTFKSKEKTKASQDNATEKEQPANKGTGLIIRIEGFEYEDDAVNALIGEIRKLNGVEDVSYKYKDELSTLEIVTERAGKLWSDIPSSTKRSFRVIEISEKMIDLKKREM